MRLVCVQCGQIRLRSMYAVDPACTLRYFFLYNDYCIQSLIYKPFCPEVNINDRHLNEPSAQLFFVVGVMVLKPDPVDGDYEAARR